MQADLVVRNSVRRGLRFPVSGEGITVLGRALSSHVILDHGDVAPAHCLLAPSPRRGGYLLIDAWTQAGTQVNGRACGKGLARVGDVLTVGPFELELAPADPSTPRPEEPAPQPPRFALRRPGSEGTAVLLSPGSALVVGRHPLADLRLDDPYVSEFHLLVLLPASHADSTPLLLDLRSSNGTSVDGRPVHRAHLLPGNDVTIGQTTLVLQPADAAELGPAAAAGGPAIEEEGRTTEVLFPDEPGSRLVSPPPEARAKPDTTSYEGFFGFDDLPFRITADPDYLFRSACHGPALMALVRWLREGRPVGVVHGPGARASRCSWRAWRGS